MLETITPEYLIQLNTLIGVGRVLNESSLESCLSAWNYYHTRELQVTAIFRGLVKNHAFADGNKRTAVEFLLTEVALGHMKFNKTDDELFDIVIAVASGHHSVEEISQMLFGD